MGSVNARRTGEADSGALLRAELARRTGTAADDWFLTFKARQAMKVAFDALAAKDCGRRKVLTQLFTCCTAVDPIAAAGLTPIYGDISPRTLALEPEGVLASEGLAAVVHQHTFGIHDVAMNESIREAAHEAGALVMEDCAHCAGRLGRDSRGVPVADVSVHSFGVEKMLPTHFGGALWVNPEMPDTALRDDIRMRFAAIPELDSARARAARTYLTQVRILNHLPHALSSALRGHLELLGLFEPAVSESERAGEIGGEVARPGEWVAAQALGALQQAEANERSRSEVVAAYERAFVDWSHEPCERFPWVCAGGLDDSQPLLRLAVFMQDDRHADEAVRRLCEAGYYTVPWYRPVLYPGVVKESRYGLACGVESALKRLPMTEACSKGAVCLPTTIPSDRVAEVVRILNEVS